VRSDKHLGETITESENWTEETYDNWSRSRRPIAVSFSGKERNHLFLSSRGERFDDISGLSGLDTPRDSRAYVLFDYDRDGWQDIALVNANAPLLHLYHNQIGSNSQQHDEAGQIIAVRFVGGNHSTGPSERFCTRDGYGAQVSVTLDDLKILREHRCGEGLSSQNSNTMLIGIGDRSAADSLVVRWPRGSIQEIKQVSAGSLLTVYEDPSQGPDESGFVLEPYRISSPSRQHLATTDSSAPRLMLSSLVSEPAEALGEIRMYTTMATWCAACKRSLPQLKFLRESFRSDELQMAGIPADPADGPEKLMAYADKYQPPYQLLTHLDGEEISAVQKIATEALDQPDILPATIVTDADSRVLLTMAGVPSVSQLRKLLSETRGQ
jgi:hypothetical protein